jgi:trimeric autotransporter adhesin
MPSKFFKTLMPLVLAASLAACGGGGGGGGTDPGGPPPPPPPPPPTTEQAPDGAFAVTPSVGGASTLRLSWPAVERATFYRVLRDKGDDQTFDIVADQLQATTFDLALPVHLTDWSAIAFRVEACNSAGCGHAESGSLLQFALFAIGSVKPAASSADLFGRNVAVSSDGNTMAIGAAGDDLQDDDSGAVYVFVREGAQWQQQAYVKAGLNARTGDGFGGALALSADGNTLAVGAIGEDSSTGGVVEAEQPAGEAGRPNSGAAYVFLREGTQWRAQMKFKAANPFPNGRFGIALALSANGNRLAVGSSKVNDNSGGVALFERIGNGWVVSGPALLGQPTDNGFGTALALSADGITLAVGAPREGVNLGRAGGAYVYVETAGSWAQQTLLSPPASDALGTEGDGFGSALSLSSDGNTLAVGAPTDILLSSAIGPAMPNDAGLPTSRSVGAVHVFQRSNGEWDPQAYIKATNSGTDFQFGSSVSLSSDGSMLAIGAPGESGALQGVHLTHSNEQGIDKAGAVYLFMRNGGTWASSRYVKAPKVAAAAHFGIGAALSGNGQSLVVGTDTDALLGTGQVFAY